MTSQPTPPAPRNPSYGRTLALVVCATGVILFLLSRHGSDLMPQRSEPREKSSQTAETQITALENSTDVQTKSQSRLHASTFGMERDKHTTTSTMASETTATATDTATSEPLQQELYLAALMELMEEEGKDNALLHYALAFEMAPPNPTPEQLALIQMVLEEGWDERAEPLVPYLVAWQAAFEKLHHGAGIEYAQGIGYQHGLNAPVPNFLKAQNAGRMLAVYSRYLQSKGNSAQAAEQLQTALKMGGDFHSPGNYMISDLIGTAIESVALKQISQLVDSRTLTPGQLDGMLNRLQKAEQAAGNIVGSIDAEMQSVLLGIQSMRENPQAHPELEQEYAATLQVNGTPVSLEQYEESYRRTWASLSEEFSRPYWEREPGAMHRGDGITESPVPIPNYADAEVRFLNVKSRLRQHQVDVAIKRYISDNGNPPQTIDALVSRNYLDAVPQDPFSGGQFSYRPTGSTYELYGSGPNIKTPNDPNLNWSPVNGTFSPGVIRIR